MPVLKNARHERFAQNVAKGMSAAEAYEKAGYKRNDGSAGQRGGIVEVGLDLADCEVQGVGVIGLALFLTRGFPGNRLQHCESCGAYRRSTHNL